jgi:hypothetical protein
MATRMKLIGHDLDDRPQAHHGRADAGADEALLARSASRARACGRTSPQAGGDLVGALEAADLLAHEEDAVVAVELLVERAAQRLAVRHVRHRRLPRRARRTGAARHARELLAPGGSP